MSAPVRLKNFVDGDWRTSDSDSWIADVNPSDSDDVLAHVPKGTVDDVAAAVAAASAAYPAWRATTGPARAELLHKWAAAIAARHEELAQLVTREVGKPIGEARGEVGRCVMILRYYAGEAVRGIGEVIPAQVAGALQFSSHQPLGVVALITPWNFPVAIPLWKAAPALAFGNTVVLKPSEMSSQSAVGARGVRGDGRPAARRRSTSFTARVTSSARRSSPPSRARGELHRLGSGWCDGRRRSGRAEHPVSDRDGRKERRDRHARCRSTTGGCAGRGRRDALCRSEVHGDESRRRGAPGRGCVSRRASRAGGGASDRPGD